MKTVKLDIKSVLGRRTYRPASLAVIAACMLALIALLGCQSGDREPVFLQEGQAAPDFSLKDIDGKPWSLSGARGSVVLINFWATWCPPSREEMPSLQALFAKTMDKPNFQIVTVLYNDDPQKARQFFSDNGYSMPILIDPGLKAAGKYGITGVPETYVVDKNGILRKKIIGPTSFDMPEAHKFLDGLIAE